MVSDMIWGGIEIPPEKKRRRERNREIDEHMKFQISFVQLGAPLFRAALPFLRSLPSLQEINIGSEARFERREIQGAAFRLLRFAAH